MNATINAQNAYTFQYPATSAMGISERAIIEGTQTPEERAANVASSARMAAGRPNSVAAFLLELHTYKMERGE